MKTVIVTGGDEHFAGLLLSCVESMASTGVLQQVDLAVLDQGLSAKTRLALSDTYGAQLVEITWPDYVPTSLRDQHQFVGVANRPLLRDLLPGYTSYLWFDADAWVQRADFLTAFIEGTRRRGTAMTLERGAKYRKRLIDRRWWMGNLVASYGVREGTYLATKPSPNIGIVGMASSSQMWDAWLSAYVEAMQRRARVNLDQHAFHAATHRMSHPPAILPSVNNWLPLLSVPAWDAEARLLCAPDRRHTPINVIHLAGPDKSRSYNLRGDGKLTIPLTWGYMREHLQAP